MRIELTPAGLVDDLAIDHANLEIRRTGTARYSFRAHSQEGVVSLVFWTTENASIEVTVNDLPEDESWCTMKLSANILESLDAKSCSVHVEQMDRRCYFLGLNRGSSQLLINFSAPGYVKAELTPATELERAAGEGPLSE